MIDKLKKYLKNLNKVAIAYSAGVDSTFLLKVAHDTLGNNVLALSVKSASFPEKELDEATKFCKSKKINHIIIDFDEFEIENFSSNPLNRCYICKKALFKKIVEIAAAHGFQHILEGSNLDDTKDYRPGMKALQELNIISPLKEIGLTKAKIREYSKKLGLKTFDKPSLACLSTRFPYGETITREKLKMVERAENMLYELGFKQYRVRYHNNLARIEVLEDEFEKLLKNRFSILKELKNIGFSYISMDLEGYRTGSLNEAIKK